MLLTPRFSAEAFAEAFAAEFETHLAGVQNSNRDWTERFRATLAKMGEEKGCEVYPSRTEENGYREGEFLYDFVWLSPKTEVNGEPRSKPSTGQVELVAECEWGRLRDIGYDFEKLILAKAPLKFLMYDSGLANDADLSGELTRRLQRYSGYLEGECYITAGCTWNATNREVTLRMAAWECKQTGALTEFPFRLIWPEDRLLLASN